MKQPGFPDFLPGRVREGTGIGGSGFQAFSGIGGIGISIGLSGDPAGLPFYFFFLYSILNSDDESGSGHF
jgi:hypothetical protein